MKKIDLCLKLRYIIDMRTKILILVLVGISVAGMRTDTLYVTGGIKANSFIGSAKSDSNRIIVRSGIVDTTGLIGINYYYAGAYRYEPVLAITRMRYEGRIDFYPQKAYFTDVYASCLYGKAYIDSLSFNNESWLKTYKSVAVICSLYDNATYRARCTFAKITQIGNVIILYLPCSLSGTLSGGEVLIKGIPTEYLTTSSDPGGGLSIPVPIRENGAYKIGNFYTGDNLTPYAMLYPAGGGVLAAGTGGIVATSITWSK